MKIKIGESDYSVLPSFLTMVRYRAENGVSILQEDITTSSDTLIKLLYSAIAGEKPHYQAFANECLNDESFEFSALSFYKQLLLKDCPEKADTDKKKTSDEFEILALCAIANIGERILDILNIFQVVKLINKYCEIKNAVPNPKEMSSEERKTLYGITPEKELEIESFLLMQKKGYKTK